MGRPSWHQYFLGLAQYASIRSHDTETKVGCVFVDGQMHVISMGYNGFPSQCEDSKLPTTRPAKYPFMVHAEENAVSNIISKNSQTSLTAYITHFPCNRCAKLLWQNGIRKWYITKGSKTFSTDKNDRMVYNHLIDSIAVNNIMHIHLQLLLLNLPQLAIQALCLQ